MSLFSLVLVSRVGAQITQVEQPQQLEHCVAVDLSEGSG